MPDHLVLPGGGQHLDDAELVADGLPGVIAQHQPDPVPAGGRSLAGRTRHEPSIFRWVCTVTPPSTRVSRCLPRDSDSVTSRPVRSVVAYRGTRKSVRVS